MVRRISILLCLLIFTWGTVVLAAPPQIQAEAAVLMVLDDNPVVLFGKNLHRRMYPASTTKITTLITALEKGNLDGTVVTSPRAATRTSEESVLGLKAGDKLKLREALYGMMLPSGNDAAEAIAETVAGTVPGFVALMNDEAKKIGATSTHFKNPHGMPDVEHFTTAYDLALLAAYGMKNPLFADIVSTREYDVRFLNRRIKHVVNTNKLLGSYAGTIGVKTGSTEAAGDCLVAAAQRGKVRLLAVILNDDYRWEDAAALFDYGFAQLGV